MLAHSGCPQFRGVQTIMLAHSGCPQFRGVQTIMLAHSGCPQFRGMQIIVLAHSGCQPYHLACTFRLLEVIQWIHIRARLQTITNSIGCICKTRLSLKLSLTLKMSKDKLGTDEAVVWLDSCGLTTPKALEACRERSQKWKPSLITSY